MIEELGTKHKDDAVVLKSFSGEVELTMTREKLKSAIINHQLCVTNMTVTKNNRLVKVADKVDWLNVELLSYDVNNGFCEVHVQSDNINQINEFMVGIERAIITESSNGNSCSYEYKDANAYGAHDIVVRYLHIDNVVNALQHISHKFDLNSLQRKRDDRHQNFSYLTDSQFYNLCDYLRRMLNCN
jgi:hypothetical protein